MAFNPTPEQDVALHAKGSVLVSAAAGSGKTAVLVNRVIDRILDADNPIDVNDLLIVTFTNAAAAEMRERIAAGLSAYAEEHRDSLRALQQKADLDSAAIGTIDAFCQDLVREHFEDAGIRSDFRIASGEQLKVLKNRVALDCLNTFLETEPEATRQMLSSLWKRDALENAAAAIEELYEYAMALPFPVAWLEQIACAYDESVPFEEQIWTKELLRQTAAGAEHYLRRLLDARKRMERDEEMAKAYSAAYASALESLEQVRAAASSGDYSATLSALAGRKLVSKGKTTKLNPSQLGMVETPYASARAFLKEQAACYDRFWREAQALGPMPGIVASVFCRITVAFCRRLDAEKYEKNLYDFADLEHAALNLLCDCVDGRPVPKQSDLTHRFREVMVDEYQDTNDLQDAIFYALSDEGRHLFLVGDVKQSIYRFRRANPTNFIRKKEEYPIYDGRANPSKVILSGNFRSRPSVCDYVNFTFRLLMTKQAAELDYLPEDELHPLNDRFAPSEAPGAEFHLVECDDVAGEAAYVAATLRRMMEEGLTVTDPEEGLRPARWSDVMILLRSYKKYAPVFREALKREGIPSWVKAQEGFFQRSEIVMALSLLRAIDNPLRDVPLLATLVSPLFGFSSEEMAKIRLSAPKRSLYAALKAHSATNAKSAAFLEKLDRYRQWAGTLPSDLLIRQVMDDVGMTAIACAMEDGAACRANLLVLADYACQYETGGYRGLSAFLRYLDRAERFGGKVGCASVQDGEDAVQILTIHHAKGLQAPVVILAATSSSFNAQDRTKTLVFDETLGVGIDYTDIAANRKYHTLSHYVIAQRDQQESVSEEMRLLYVAMTRAQERLILVAHEKNAEKAVKDAAALITGNDNESLALDDRAVNRVKKASSWLIATALMHPDADSLRRVAQTEIPVLPAKEALRVVIGRAPESPSLPETEQPTEEKDFSAYLDYRYPYEDLLRFEAKYSVSQLAKSTYDPVNCCTAKPAFVSGDALTPAEKGTATHRFMCFADYDRARTDVAGEIARLVSEGRLTEEQGKGIDVETVEAFFDSEMYARIEKADRVLRESRFLYEMPLRRLDPACDSNETVVVQGVADCVLFEPDGITILDFKTDRRCTEEDLIAKYTRQLEVYADAFSSDYRLPRKTPYLYSFSLKRCIPIPDGKNEKK